MYSKDLMCNIESGLNGESWSSDVRKGKERKAALIIRSLIKARLSIA